MNTRWFEIRSSNDGQPFVPVWIRASSRTLADLAADMLFGADNAAFGGSYTVSELVNADEPKPATK